MKSIIKIDFYPPVLSTQSELWRLLKRKKKENKRRREKEEEGDETEVPLS